jgi:hypothetical protein
MIRTDAPKDLEGRGLANFARTTPELPGNALLAAGCSPYGKNPRGGWFVIFTMRPCDLAPDHPDLGSTLLLLAPVDVRDLLA